MRPGQLNRRITLKRPTLTNTSGDAVSTLQVVDTVWCDVRPMRVDERFQSSALHSVRTSNFRIYYRSDVTPDMLLGYDGLDWKIVGVAELGFRDGLDITAEAVY